MDLLTLLERKNRCVSRMVAASAEFLSAQGEPDMELARLEALEKERSVVIKVVDLLDRKIAQAVLALEPRDRTPDLVARVEEADASLRNLLIEIEAQDARILAWIEAETGRVSDELRKTRKSGDTLSKFKSSWMGEPGGGVDWSV